MTKGFFLFGESWENADQVAQELKEVRGDTTVWIYFSALNPDPAQVEKVLEAVRDPRLCVCFYVVALCGGAATDLLPYGTMVYTAPYSLIQDEAGNWINGREIHMQEIAHKDMEFVARLHPLAPQQPLNSPDFDSLPLPTKIRTLAGAKIRDGEGNIIYLATGKKRESREINWLDERSLDPDRRKRFAEKLSALRQEYYSTYSKMNIKTWVAMLKAENMLPPDY